jgi:hypothetical protein
MRILVAIPHYFAPSTTGAHASERGAAEARAGITRLCLASLRQNFSAAQSLIDGAAGRLHPANRAFAGEVAIALCTTGERHLLADLAGLGVEHVRTAAEPRLLGFECHKVLRCGLGQYDYFAYLEDDLRIADGLFFDKLAWFARQFGDDAVLQPNRFEIASDPPYKLYIDGNLHDARSAAGLQRSAAQQHLSAPVFAREIIFQRVQNPHSGCFFLSAAQLSRWAAQPDFAVPHAAFWGPLESAATYGIMRHFRVYKPARENAAFLEIEHLDPRYLGRRFRPSGDPPSLQWD